MRANVFILLFILAPRAMALPWTLETDSAIVSASPLRTLAATGSPNTLKPAIDRHLSSLGGKYWDSVLKEQLVDTLQNILKRGGYFWNSLAFYETHSDSTVAVVVDITSGPPTLIARITLHGEDDKGKDLTEAFLLASGEQFSADAMSVGINAMLNWLERRGYPLASVFVDSIRTVLQPGEPSAVDLFFTIRKGEQFVLSEFRIEGNRETKTEVIQREVKNFRGIPYSPSVAISIHQRINRLRLFSRIEVSEPMKFDDEQFGLTINVTETNYVRFDGMLGYVPAVQPAGEGYFTGLIDLNFGNLFGTGRRLGVRWFREQIQTEEIDLRYFEPWVFSVPLNMEAGYSSRKQDSTYFRTRYIGNADYAVNDIFSLSFSLESMLLVAPQHLPNSNTARSNTLFYGIGVIYDTRDDPLTPMSGLFVRTKYQSGPKSISVPSVGTQRVSNERLMLDAFGYLPLSRRMVLQTGVVGKKATAGILEPGDLFLVGGNLLLRGYRDNEFAGSSVLVGSIEQRYLLSSRSYVYGFVDHGYIGLQGQQETGLKEMHLNRTGYGLGVRLESGVGLIGISYAVGKGDTFSTGKIHFRVVNEF